MVDQFLWDSPRIRALRRISLVFRRITNLQLWLDPWGDGGSLARARFMYYRRLALEVSRLPDESFLRADLRVGLVGPAGLSCGAACGCFGSGVANPPCRAGDGPGPARHGAPADLSSFSCKSRVRRPRRCSLGSAPPSVSTVSFGGPKSLKLAPTPSSYGLVAWPYTFVQGTVMLRVDLVYSDRSFPRSRGQSAHHRHCWVASLFMIRLGVNFILGFTVVSSCGADKCLRCANPVQGAHVDPVDSGSADAVAVCPAHGLFASTIGLSANALQRAYFLFKDPHRGLSAEIEC